jgi:hypothetical protein
MFFGWAVSCVANKLECDAEEDDSMDEVSGFCQELFVKHDQVFENEEYVQDFVQLNNRGDLALVSSPYFHFGLQLPQKKRDSFNKATSKAGTPVC